MLFAETSLAEASVSHATPAMGWWRGDLLYARGCADAMASVVCQASSSGSLTQQAVCDVDPMVGTLVDLDCLVAQGRWLGEARHSASVAGLAEN